MDRNGDSQDHAGTGQGQRRCRRVFMRDLEIVASVGVFEHEKRYEQRIGLDAPDDPVSAPPGAMGSAAVAEGDGTDAPAPEPAAKQPRKGGQFAKKQPAEVAAEAEDVA